VFGKVTKGLDVVNAIVKGDVITDIEIKDPTAALFAAQKTNLDEWNSKLKRKRTKPAAATPLEEKQEVWKQYPKEISSDKWEKRVDFPAEFDYDVWDCDKMKQVHFFDEEKIAIYADKNGNHIWTHKNIQSNVELIDKELGLYIVTTYHMDDEGLFVNPDASPVQMKSNKEIGAAAYDRMWNDNWHKKYCLKAAFYRMLELEEEEPD
jgi:hypothetical protein